MIPEITQDNFRLLLPGKIARAVKQIAEQSHKQPLDVLADFYLSNLYKELEREGTKLWWESPLQLCRDYIYWNSTDMQA
jgi:hypothetical protein